MSNPLLFVNFGSSSADTCFNDTFTDNYVSNCRILQYITTIRPDRPSHIIGWPPYLRHAEGAHPNMVSYRELGQNPETLVVYTRNHPQGQNSNYFIRLWRRIQVRSRSNPSSVNLLFSLLTQCFRISKMIPISTTTDCWRKEKFTTDLKKYQITEAIQIRGKFLALTAEVHSVGDFVKKYHGQRKSGKV